MKRILCIAALASLIGTGCIKKKSFDFSNLTVDNWQPDWALPILNSNLTLKNIIQPNTFLTEDAEGVFSLHYSGDLFSALAVDYIFVPDQHYVTPSMMPGTPLNLPSFTGSFNSTFSNNFTYSDPSGTQLSHLSLKGGALRLDISSTLRHNVTATLIFPSVKKGGVALQVVAPITYPASLASVTIDLAGYTFDMTNGSTTKNYLPYQVLFSVTGTGQPISSGEGLDASVHMTDLKYSFLDGFLGSYDIPMPSDTINVAVFDNTLTADIFVDDPRINLVFKNSFGLNVAAKLDNVYGFTTTGKPAPLMAAANINVNGATIPGQSKSSNYTLDRTNSNVQNLFNPAPNHVIYDGRVRVNPNGSGSTYSFLTDSSAISIAVDAELPAWFRIIEFTVQDTSKLLLPEDSSVLQSAQFKMLMDNALPLYGRVQLYFADENYNFLDSLVPTAQDIIGEAPVDVQGRVNGRKANVTTFEMDHDHYNAMATKVRHAIIRGSLKTSGNNSVKIQSSNNLIVKLAFRFKLNVASTDL